MTSQQNNQHKKLSALMRTTALTAVGLVAVALPSQADDYTLPVNGQVVGGSSTITNPSVGLLNINQHTDRTVINWDSFNIGRDGTVQFFQPGTGSLAVNRVTGAGNDPTKILGTLRANGNVMVLDRNGVLFGKDSVVDVGGLIASSGNVDTQAIMNGGRFLALSDLGSGGDVVNQGTITVSDSGLAAFVAPVVENNGVINARMGRVALAAGVDTATVDLYGDGLVELTVGGNAAKVLAKNSGVINAAGGQVQMTVAAAKSVVDQAINMDGVINASHATVKGGKIVLSGGNAKVNVSGKMNATGATGGGNVSVTGAEVKIESGATIDANATVSGNGGTLYVVGDRTYYYGAMSARGAGAGRGGDAEVSGRTVDMTGSVDLTSASGKFGTLLIDPSGMIIQSDEGIVNGSIVLGDYNISYFNDLYIASLLALGNVTMIGNDFIDVGTRRAGYSFVTANAGDDVAANAILNSLGNGNIELGVYDGTTTIGTLNLNGTEINFNRDTTIGLGGFDVTTSTINLDGKLYGTLADTTTHPILGASRLTSNAGVVNVISNNALIQQGLDFVAVNGTVNVGAGVYNETLKMAKNGVTLKGAKNGVAGDDASRGANETVIKPNSPGILVTADNTTVDGVVINGADYGIHVSSADNVTLKNNIIIDSTIHGVYAVGSAGLDILNSVIDTTLSDGIRLISSHDAVVRGNTIAHTLGNAFGYGSGIYVANSNNAQIGGAALGDGNTIFDTDWDGVKMAGGSNGQILGNDISDVMRAGVSVSTATNATVEGNTVNGAGKWGIWSLDNANVDILGNVVSNILGEGWGVYVKGGADATINYNTVSSTAHEGILVENVGAGAGGSANILHNVVFTTGGHGISVLYTDGASIISNEVGLVGGANNIQGDGIRVNNSHNSIIESNRVRDTKRLSNGYGSGIYALFSDNLLITDNTTSMTGWDGIKVLSGNGSVVTYNYISEAQRAGIAISSTTNAKVEGNDISFTGKWGVWSARNTDLKINDNDIRNVTELEGIYSVFDKDMQITDNDIRLTGKNGILVEDASSDNSFFSLIVSGNYVGTSGQDGIGIVRSNKSYIQDNDVGSGAEHIARDGISIIDSAQATVKQNDVKNVGRYGIFVDPSPNASVTYNTVNNTGSHGVYVLESDNANVSYNQIGTLGGAGNIKGDGIRAVQSNYLTADSNTITNVAPVGSGFGSGIYLAYSSNGNILNNNISNTKWDGVKLNEGTNNNVHHNTIHHVTRAGVAIGNNTDSFVQNNIISSAGIWGVWSNLNTNLDILVNSISSVTTGEGIRSIADKNLTISGNHINSTGKNGVLVEDGVFDAGNSVTVTGNFIGGSGLDGVGIVRTADANVTYNNIGSYYYGVNRDGVSIVDSPSTTVNNNLIANVGRYGVFVDPSDYTSVTYNGIYNTGSDGVYILDSDFVTVDHNTIGGDYYGGYYGSARFAPSIFSGYYGNIGGHGVHFANSNGGTISYNTILNTELNGVFVENAYPAMVDEEVSTEDMFTTFLALPGNGVNIHNNNIFNIGWDGVNVTNSSTAVVDTNQIGVNGHVNGNGVSIINTPYSTVSGNTITNVGGHGVFVDPSDNTTVSANIITNVDRHGIYVLDSDNVRILNNFIGQDGPYDSIGWDGIQLRNSAGSEISGNTIYNVGQDGISAYGIYGYLMISGNNIYNVHHDGIYVEGGMPFVMMDKKVQVYDGYYGYYGGYYGAPEVYIEGNVVQNSGGFMPSEMGKFVVNDGYYGYYGYNGFAAIEVDVGADGYAGISGNNVGSFFEYGLYASSGEIDLTGAANIIHDTNIGMGFYPHAPYVYDKFVSLEAPILGDLDYLGSLLRLTDNTIGFTQFVDQSEQFVDLGYGAFFMPGAPTLLDGMRATYTTAGVTIDPAANGGKVTQAEADYLESMFTHYVDFQDRGLFLFPVIEPAAIDQKDIFRVFGRFVPATTGGSLIITGLPSVGGGAGGAGGGAGGAGGNFVFAANNLNEIAPAAGDEEGQDAGAGNNPAGVEPAAGNGVDNAPCWGDANQALDQGTAVQINYGNSTSQALEDAVSCGAQTQL